MYFGSSSGYQSMPASFAGASPPKAKFGSKFYNPSKDWDNNFISHCAKILAPLMNEDPGVVAGRTINISHDDFLSVFGDISNLNVDNLEDVGAFLSALNAKQGVLSEILGNDKESWKLSGHYDSLLVLGLMEHFKNPALSESQKGAFKAEISSAVILIEELLKAENVDDQKVINALQQLQGQYGALINLVNPEYGQVFNGAFKDIAEVKNAAKWLKNKFIDNLENKLADYKLSEQERNELTKIKKYLQKKAVEPAVGFIAAGNVDRVVSQSYEDRMREQEYSDLMQEKAQKQQVAKRKAEASKAEKSAIQEKKNIKEATKKQAG